jgi:chain length determinant protein EpsF
VSFGQFLSIMRARWRVLLLVLGVTVATTVAVSLLLPRQYTASASVVVDNKPDPVSAVFYGGAASPVFIATQVDVIKSERVAMRVVRNLGLADDPQVRGQWLEDTKGEGTIEQWLVGLFQKQMDVTPSRESSVIAISYQAPSPRFAAALANGFAQAYLETSLELRVDPARQYSTFFDSRAKEAREALEQAQSRVSAFQKANGIIATDERLDVENARLSELSSQLVALQALASESASRQAQAQSAQADRIQEVLNNPLLNQQKADITRAEARLQELNSRLGDNHPQVREARASLAELRSRLEADTRRVTGSVGVTNTITRQRLTEVSASLEAQRAKVLRMKAVRDEGMVLVRDVENAQRAYDTVLQRFNQTNLESQTTQGSANILTQAVPPLEHSSPKLLLNTLLSVFLGALLAVGTALLLELMDRRVRSVDDVVEALDLPVMGIIPRPGGSRLGLGRKRPSVMQHRLLAPLSQTKGA